MSTKSLSLSGELHAYLLAHSTPPDEIVSDLIAETRDTLPDRVSMQIAPEQASFMTMLAQLTGARRAVEIGTFTGLSSLAVARGMPADGKLICFDISEEFTAIARRYWQRAGVADRIELIIGDAQERLPELPADPHLDLAFIDADKPGYPAYWAELVPRMRPGGLIMVDNVLQRGLVIDPDDESPQVTAIRAFNRQVRDDDRVDVVMLPIADGLTLARRR